MSEKQGPGRAPGQRPGGAPKGPGMKRRVSEFLGNESSFGRLMQLLWVIIGGNLMFVLFSLPLLTIGASQAGLYRVCLRYLRGERDESPIREFWKGFRMNLRQGILSWILLVLFGLLAYVDVRFCDYYGGVLGIFKVLILGLVVAVLLFATHFYPVLSAFSDSLGALSRNALFFAAKNPLRALLILGLHLIPLGVTYLHTRLQPLYVFLWASCGFGLIAMAVSLLLKGDFSRYLPEVDAYGNYLTEEEILQRRQEEEVEPAQAARQGKKKGKAGIQKYLDKDQTQPEESWELSEAEKNMEGLL